MKKKYLLKGWVENLLAAITGLAFMIMFCVIPESISTLLIVDGLCILTIIFNINILSKYTNLLKD